MIKQISSHLEHTQAIWSVAFHPTGHFYLTCSSDLTILAHPYPQTSPPTKVPIPTSHTKTLRFLTFHPTQPLFACASFDSKISIYTYTQKPNSQVDNNSEDPNLYLRDVKNLEFSLVHILEGQEHEIKQIHFNDHSLASCARDQSVWLWDSEYDCQNTLQSQGDVKTCCFIEGGLLTGGFDGVLRVYLQDEDEFLLVKSIEIKETIWDIKVFEDVWVLGDDTGKIWIIDAKQMNRELQEEDDFEGDRGIKIVSVMQVHDRACLSLSFSYDGQWLVSGGGDNKICVLQKEIQDGILAFRTIDQCENAHTQDVNQVVFHPKEMVFLSVSDDQKVKMWEIN